MKKLRKLLLLTIAVITLPCVALWGLSCAKADLRALPELHTGDLVFQTSITSQTPAIWLATHNLYSHVGIVHKTAKGVYVIEAMQHVAERPLEEFVQSGWGERFTVLRYTGLSDAQREAVAKAAQTYLGRRYDFVFSLHNDAIYCSELPYLAFGAAGIPVGKVEKIRELHLDNFAVRKLFDERWRLHPACQAADMDAAQCWKVVLDEPIVTPASVAQDSHLSLVYSNYWF